MGIGKDILGTLDEGLKLGLADKKVLDAFLDKKSAEGTKLSTDGTTLDGLWMGGSGIAVWEKGKIQMPDLGSKAAETVQKVLKKKAPKNWLGEGVLEEGGGIGPAKLTVADWTGQGKWGGALLLDIQGDMTLGTFYKALMDYAKGLGIPSVPIEKVMGSFNYGFTNRTYLFFEIRFDDEKDVIETMEKAKRGRVMVTLMTPERATPAILDTAKAIKAKIGR